MKLLFVMMLFTGVLRAGEPSAISGLTLEAAFDLAERLHPDLAEGQALLDDAAARASGAGKFPNPEAIAGVESAPLRGRSGSEAEYLAGAAQTVPLGGRMGKARAAGMLEREVEEQALKVRRFELRRRVHAAFATALYQEQAALLLADTAAGFSKAVLLAQARIEAGDALPEELARLEMDHANARLEANRAGSLRVQAMLGLAAAVGAPDLRVQKLAGRIDEAFALPAIEEMTIALDAHPSLALADAEARAGQARIDLAKAERIPDLKVELLYRRLPGGAGSAADFGISIPLPIFDRGKSKVREAQALTQAAEARRSATAIDLRRQAQEAHASLASALARSKALRDEILPRAETVLKAVELRHELGDTALGELLLARRDWANVRLAWLESARDTLQAWVELNAMIAFKPSIP